MVMSEARIRGRESCVAVLVLMGANAANDLRMSPEDACSQSHSGIGESSDAANIS